MEPDIQQQQQITMESIIEVLKKIKKNDKLFKPLKKLKAALQKFDIKNISTQPTQTILLFHFGLGSQIDKQLLELTSPNLQNASDAIIPGKAYCFLKFDQINKVKFYVSKFEKIMDYGFYFDFGDHNNFDKGGSRIFIALFWKGQIQDTKLENQNLKNCCRKYQKDELPGLILEQNFLNQQQQQQILKEIQAKPWQRLNNRRVQHYGFEFKYGANNINKQQKAKYQLPKWTNIIINKFKQNFPEIVKKNDGSFDQLTINDYFAGDGIPAHFDTHSPFQQYFISVSMLSGTVMEFRKYDGQEKNIYFPSKCLVIFSGQARYAWTHAISCRKIDKIDQKLIHRQRRISLTFRKIRFQPCCCPYYFYCDSQGYDQKIMKKNNPLLKKYLHETKNQQIIEKLAPQQLQDKYVSNAYNGFGHNFDNQIISDIRKFLEKDIQPGYIVLDVGCGNGIYQNAIKVDCFYVGVETCKLMSGLDGEERMYMDGKKLFFKNDSFDAVLLIAVLHHFATQQGRLSCLLQINRVLKKGAHLYLTVFDYQSKKHIYRSQDTLWQYCLPSHKIMQQNQQKKQQPYQSSRGDVYSRYYHLFKEEQLTNLVQKANFQIIVCFHDTENIIMKIQKK